MCPPLSQTAATPRATGACPPFLQTAPKPTNGADDAVTVREDTPWPGTGKMSGNLFEERNWVLPKDYLAIEGKSRTLQLQRLLQKKNPKLESKPAAKRKKNVVGDSISPFVKPKRKMLIHPIYKNR